MGNLARATYEKSTMCMWPWSYDQCDGSINELEAKQQISACNSDPGYGMHPHQGRGAPEIDIFEVMPGHSMPFTGPVEAFMSSSLQISPGIAKANPRRPKNGLKLNSSQIWYDDVKLGNGVEFNYGFWGQECGPERDPSVNKIHKYMEDAISANRYLNETHFDDHHLYTLDWQPGPQGYLYWYLDDELILGIDGLSIQKRTGAMIPMEPMYLILNTAISHRWGMPEPCPVASCSSCWRCYDCTNPDCQCSLPDGMKNCKNLPAEMKIDFIRLYQDLEDSSHTIGCSPDRFPTAEFIQAHPLRYMNWMPMTASSQTRYWSFIITSSVILLLLMIAIIMQCCINRYKKQVPGYSKLTHSMELSGMLSGTLSEKGRVVEIISNERFI